MALSQEAQVKMFGKTTAEMDAEWEEKGCPSPFYITCILSDVQEALTHDDTESARQWLNKAKYFLTDKMYLPDTPLRKG